MVPASTMPLGKLPKLGPSKRLEGMVHLKNAGIETD
jgi:hypothetical protein